MNDVGFAPRAQVAAWLRDGWRLVPGHEYGEGDWAIVMIRPENPVDLTETQMRSMARRFRPGPAKVRSNRARATSSRYFARFIEKRASQYISRRIVQEMP